MASKTTLNAQNLQALGVERLAELTLELATGNAAAKRRLKLELLQVNDPASLARDVQKRLTSISRSKAYIHWSKQKTFAADLEHHRIAIEGPIARLDPVLALDLMWQLIDLTPGILARTNDKRGQIEAIVNQACASLPELNKSARTTNDQQVTRLIEALGRHDAERSEEIAKALLPELDDQGSQTLQEQVDVWLEEANGRPIKAVRARAAAKLLQMLADARGDVDAFIAQQKPATRKHPEIATQIGKRLLQAGRAEEALGYLTAADESKASYWRLDWEIAQIEALEALDRQEEAQALRLKSFRRHLFAKHLRDYLKNLPDFDDIEAERAILGDVVRHKYPLPALAFLIAWPALDHAAQIVRNRSNELDPAGFDILSNAAETLASKHPFASIMLRRILIIATLRKGERFRYRQIASHLDACFDLSDTVTDYQDLPDHVEFVNDLQDRYGHVRGFWSRVMK